MGASQKCRWREARNKARELKEKIRQGIDPVQERKDHRLKLVQSNARSLSFAEAAKRCHAVKAQSSRTPSMPPSG
ncbi:MAG: hypothetical protein ACNA7T_14890 [Haliea sp.]